jgi:hypothetical protein
MRERPLRGLPHLFGGIARYHQLMPTSTLADMARRHYPYRPVDLLRQRFDSIRNTPYVTCPVFVVAADRDGIVPHGQSQRPFAATWQTAPIGAVTIPILGWNGGGLRCRDMLTGSSGPRPQLLPNHRPSYTRPSVPSMHLSVKVLGIAAGMSKSGLIRFSFD